MGKHNNFLSDYYKDTFDKAETLSIDEPEVASMIAGHSKNGFIVLFMHDETEAKQFNGALYLVKHSDYTFTPLYVHFVNVFPFENQKEVVRGRAIIVYNQNKDGKVTDYISFKVVGLVLIGMGFCKSGFFKRSPDDIAEYVTLEKYGNKTTSADSTLEDLLNDYYLAPLKRDDFDIGGYYVNLAPQSLSEAHNRFLSNEITLPYR